MNGASDLLTTAELVRRDDFTLGAVQVSPSTRKLSGPGGEGSLEPRAMQVLVVLADAAGRVVTREELFRRCWGAAVVGDDSLNRAVADVRRLARTVGDEGFRIQTVPRAGYRLLIEAAFPPGSVRPIARRAMFALAGLGVAGAIGAGLWRVRRDHARAQAAALIGESEQEMRAGSPEGHGRAVRALERAADLASDDPLAWGRLALARYALSEESPPEQATALVAGVQDAARRALTLSPRQPDALSALAILPPYFGDWAAAEQRMDRVLDIAPDHLTTRDARAFLLTSVGRVRENLAERLAMAKEDSLSANLLYRLIYAHWIAGEVEAADRVADKALQLWPRHPGAWFARLWTLAFTGRADRALAHLADASLRPDLPDFIIDSLGTALRALDSGRRADVQAAAAQLVAQVSLGPPLSVNAILLLGGLGEVDRAFEVATAYFLEEGPLMASVRWRPGQFSVSDQRRRKTHMLFVPATSGLRADSRFEILTERIGLAAYWRGRGIAPDYRNG